MSRFEIYLSKNDLEHIANGYDIKIKINGKRFLETNEIILKPELRNDIMNPLNLQNFIYLLLALVWLSGLIWASVIAFRSRKGKQ